MTVAILTKYFGPTDYKGARVKAYTETGLRLVIGWDDALSVEDNHTAAAHALAHKYDWDGQWFAGSTKEGYSFVVVRGNKPSFDVKRG